MTTSKGFATTLAILKLRHKNIQERIKATEDRVLKWRNEEIKLKKLLEFVETNNDN